jgi:integrator complex subunit 7
MTDQEHGQVSRLVSILLLGFLLPHSTGNEFFLLQNLSSQRINNRPHHQSAGSHTSEGGFAITSSSEGDDMGDCIIHMPLEERLQCASLRYSPDEFGELESIVHEHLDVAFCSFLTRALGPFLSGRPAHTQQVDLLHIISMAIHPHPSEQSIRQTAAKLEECEAWEATKVLMSSLVSHNFHINYGHRLQLVKLVADFLVLPEIRKNNNAAINDAKLFEGALPHLRASLYAFGMAAMNPYDAHLAQCGLVSVAVQTGVDYVVKEEWGRLLHRLVDDRTDHKCSHHDHTTTTEEKKSMTFSLMMTTDQESFFCPHRARGQLLERFLTKFNQSRHYADEKFLQHSLASLTDAIEWQVDCWTNEPPEESEENEENEEMKDAIQTISDPPCLLASLLLAAKPLFYFLLPILNVDDQSGKESEESHRRDMLVSCGIQLVHHWDSSVAHEASVLLVLAFCYGPGDMVVDYIGAIFESTKLALLESLKDRTPKRRYQIPIESMVATFSQKSLSYADSMLSLLLSPKQRKTWKLEVGSTDKSLAVSRLIAAIATANPVAAVKHVDKLVEQVQSVETKDDSRVHLMAALLACRRARFFAKDNDTATSCIVKALSSGSQSGWDSYLLARQAMVTGNFAIAKDVYQRMENMPTSETSYLWLSALKHVAEAEASLSINAAKGIPFATTQLRSARGTLYSLASFSESSSGHFTFQTELLDLRLDFLDLIATTRQLTREMRLTGIGPKKNTRPSLHLRNAVKFLNVLATKYLTAYRQHGLFICQQSRTSLRTLHAFCRFVASAAKSTFVDSLPETSMGDFQLNAIQALTLPKGDSCHPLTILMKRLDSSVLKDMDGSVDAKIRAAAMLEILDGVLKAPTPFPKDFTLTKSVPYASMRLAGDPDLVDAMDEHADVDEAYDDEIEVSPGTAIAFFASGSLPSKLLARSRLPFNTVLLWHTVSFRGHIHDDDPSPEEKQDEENASASDVKSNSSVFSLLGALDPAPTASSLSTCGTFFMKVECLPLQEEGLYRVETRLGCRDIRGGEWELPLKESARCISVRVSRSRS